MNLKQASSLIVTAFLCGCSSMNAQYQVPVPQDHAAQQQKKLQASKHWDVIASDIAMQSVQSLDKQHLKTLEVSISSPLSTSPFNLALHQFVTTRLVNEGVKVRKTGVAPLEMEHDIQVVRFESQRSNRRNTSYTPGEYTAITSGLTILHNAVTKWSSDSITTGSIGLGVLADIVAMESRDDNSRIPIPNVEVIVNSSILKDGLYVMRRSDVYYINEQDEVLYKSIPKKATTTLRVVNNCENVKGCK